MSLPYMARWRDSIFESDLDRTAMLVCFAIGRYMNAQGRAFPSRATIGRLSKLSVRAVDQAISRAERVELLRVDRTRGRISNAYVATIPTANPGSPLTANDGSPFRKSTANLATPNGESGDTQRRTPVRPKSFKATESPALNAGGSLEGAPASATFDPEEVARKAAEL